MPMTEAHKKALRAALSTICDCMEPASLLTSLESKFVLKRDDVDDIKMNGFATRRQQVEKLIHLLQSKSDSAFDLLISALNETEQRHVSNVIIKKYQGL